MLRKEPVILDEFVRTGQVKLQFRHILDHGLSLLASTAAECAGQQGAFWRMHDALFTHQDQLWSGSTDILEQFAADLNLDSAAFAQCLADENVQRRVRQINQDAKSAGVRVRPTFDINGTRVQGSPGLEQWRQLLRSMLP